MNSFNISFFYRVLVLGVSSVVMPTYAADLSSVRAWAISASYEIRGKTTDPNLFPSQWSLSIRASGRAEAQHQGTMNFMWGGVNPMNLTAQNGQAQVEGRWEQRDPGNGTAAFPGGTTTCTLSGSVPAVAMVMAMPGQPVTVGVTPVLPATWNCSSTGEYPPQGANKVDIPECLANLPLPTANGRRIGMSGRCREGDSELVYSIEAVPAAGR